MKILWHSVAPWVPTGYGQQTATNVPRVRDLGHDVAISAYYGLQGAKLRWQGIDVYPSYAESYGVDALVPHAIDWFGGADAAPSELREVSSRGLIVTLCDVYVLDVPLLNEMACAAWTPVDHTTLPPNVRNWFHRTGAVPIAMSRFGEKAMLDEGIKPFYVPHGIDTTVFSPGDQTEARERVGIPEDAFAIAIVAANVGKDGNRKAFAEQIAAFTAFRRRHDDAFLVLHTDAVSPVGTNLNKLLEHLPRSSWTYTDQAAYRRGLPASTVADVYRSADVLSNCSWGEGFGIPIIEAQACGTPVVVTDATAMPELTGAGWTVDYEPYWHDSQSAWAAKPVIGSIVDAYEEAYEHAADMREDARNFAIGYDADLVAVEHWEPTLRSLEDALERRREDAGKPVDTLKIPAKIVESDDLLWYDRGAGTDDRLGWGHEPELNEVLPDLMPEGGVLLDVGAHVGHWTLRLAGKAKHVIAVEANPETATILRRNIAINDIDNVHVMELAAWNERGSLTLSDPNQHRAGGSTRTIPGEDDSGQSGAVSVPALPLDEMPSLKTLERLDLIKLDVEGADVRALRGMSKTIRRFKPTLFVETHDAYGYYERADLEAVLRDLGYKWEVAFTYQTAWHPEGIRDEPVESDYLLCRPDGST